MTLALSEYPRGLWSIARLAFHWRGLLDVPRGDGRPVLVLPGLATGDSSNFFLRRYLRRIGYRAYGWELGRNLGTRTVGADAEHLIARIEHLRRKKGAPVTLIGVSLGGVLARLVAHRRPDLVREVITLAAPFAGHPLATNVWRAFEALTGESIHSPSVAAVLEEVRRPLPVPATAIWSPRDGFVSGQICRSDDEAGCRSIKVRSSHVAVQFTPEVLRSVAETLGESVRKKR